jgi:hypothetical protein
MTDDQTRAYETSTPEPTTPPPGDPGPATPPPSEPAPATPPPPAVTQPARSGSNRGRWILGLGLAGLVIALTAGALIVLNSGSATPEALKYIPADSAMVAEVRMDLPGDQMQKLGNFLAHFPGFQDQSTLADKLDEGLSRLVGSASEGGLDYRTELKPWLNGPAFIGVMAPPPGTEDGPAVLSATTNGAVDCTKVIEGQTPTHETVGGLDVAVYADLGVACVVDGRQALLGVESAVRAALEAKANGTGMDKSAGYAAARKQLQGDQLAVVYVDGKTLATFQPSPGPSLPIPGMEALAGRIPDWLIVGLRAEDDALVLDGVVAPLPAPSGGPSLIPAPAAHASVIAPLVPAGTLLYLEDQGTGVSLQNLLAQLRAIPEAEAPLQMLDGVGGPEGLVGWIEDAGIAVSAADPTPDNPNAKVSVFLVAKDDATAAEKVATVKTFLGLAGLSGEGISVTTETMSGVEVTTVTITDLGSLVPPGSVPGLDTGSLDTPVSFSLAGRGRIVYLTVGDGAMEDALGVVASTSLADDPAFKQAAQHGLSNSRTTVYAAVGASVDLVKGFVPPEMASEWAELAPYVDPLEAVGFSVTTDPSATRSRAVLTVSHPQ